MKKSILVACTILSLIGLYAFTTPAANNTEKSTNATFSTSTSSTISGCILASDDWKMLKDNVPYCDADKDVCEGYGKVWINTDTKQVAFQPSGYSSKFDLSIYTKKEGYNYRCWFDNKYHYLNINIPRSAFK